MNKIKIGIADAHGIESYINKKGNEHKQMLFVMRANLNRQRHAVAYEITLTEKIDKEIERLLKKKQYTKAMKHLKENAKEIKLAGGGNIQNSWDLIPNPKLDPYH